MEQITEYLSEVLIRLEYPSIAKHLGLIIYLIIFIFCSVIPLFLKYLQLLRKYLQQKKLWRDLHPFFTPVDIKKATQYYIPTKCQNIAPSKEVEPSSTHAFVTKEPIIPFLLQKAFMSHPHNEDHRFLIVLADSGMGKTTFMINLYLKYMTRKWFRDFHVKLLPLGYPDIDSEIDNIPDNQKEKIILLLDAFDEDSEAENNYKKRMDDLISKTWRFRNVLITCRTQFFPSEEEEPRETGVLKYGGDKGEHIFRKLYISPFDNRDIRSYLRKRFPFYKLITKLKAGRIIRNAPNLMVRPMLLNYIDDLSQKEEEYKNTASIYEELISKWIERESRRKEATKRETFQKELFEFSRAIAINMYRNREERRGLFIEGDDIKPFAELHNVALEEMEMKSRSLLNRNARGQYKFSHKSIVEYFLALEAFNNLDSRFEVSFEGMETAKKFFYELFFEKGAVRGVGLNSIDGWYHLGDFVKKPISAVKVDDIKFIKALTIKNSSRFTLNLLVICEQLLFLEMATSEVSDVTPVSAMRRLKWLKLYENNITNLTPLSNLRELVLLNLTSNNIVEIDALSSNTRLEELFLAYNEIADINALKGLINLYILDLSANRIGDLDPLKDCTNLFCLKLGNNMIVDISGLRNLKRLVRLELHDNKISDFIAIINMQNLGMLTLQNNQISDISPLKELVTLSYLDISNNPIMDISALLELKNLVMINITNTKVSLDGLEALSKTLPDCRIVADERKF